MMVKTISSKLSKPSTFPSQLCKTISLFSKYCTRSAITCVNNWLDSVYVSAHFVLDFDPGSTEIIFFKNLRHNFPREKLFKITYFHSERISIKRNSWMDLFIYKQLSTWIVLRIVINSISWFMTKICPWYSSLTHRLGDIKLIIWLSANVKVVSFCSLSCKGNVYCSMFTCSKQASSSGVAG